jgi:GTPase Era involved in 16S rRNA processing
MQLISEDIIESVIDAIEESEETPEMQIEQLEKEQPMLLAYLANEQFDTLTEEERSYLFYLTWVIYQSAKTSEQVKVLPMITEEALGEAEEDNWETYLDNTSKDFRRRLDPFFEATEQEDLLAFLEDALIDDDDATITEVGRDLLFIGLKTVMDCIVDN